MSTQTNPFIVVLDTCVLAPMPICDTLLRLAEDPAFYMPRWSQDILDELQRTLRTMGYTETQARRRVASMNAAFEDALVTGYDALVPTMTNDPKDRHVLAAAVRCKAHAIVTDNRKHFPEHSVAPYDIEVLTSDEFLVHQLHLNRELLEEKLHRQADARGVPYGKILQRLEKRAPKLVDLLLRTD